MPPEALERYRELKCELKALIAEARARHKRTVRWVRQRRGKVEEHFAAQEELRRLEDLVARREAVVD